MSSLGPVRGERVEIKAVSSGDEPRELVDEPAETVLREPAAPLPAIESRAAAVLRAFEGSPEDPRVQHDLALLFGLAELPAELVSRRDDLLAALRARIGATQYHPKTKKIGGQKYVVHNPEVANMLRASWSRAAIRKTIDILQKHGTFQVTTDPKTGLIRTADAAETWEMNDRQWTTDSVMCGQLQKHTDPEGYKKSMLVNAATLSSPAFAEHAEKAIQDPRYFRDGGKTDGIPHIFLPTSVVWDPVTSTFDASKIQLDASWFNHKRLESQALLLGALAELLAEGAYSAIPAQEKQVRVAVERLAKYLLAVNTNSATGEFDFAAPSASSWEETPLAGGMTWDSAASVRAMEKLRGLDVLSADVLESFISAGRRFVAARIEGSDGPAQHPSRPADTSLLLLAASDYQFHPGDPVADARMRLSIVEAMKKHLLREHGMLRYSKFTLEGAELYDSYLNRDFWMPGPLRSALAGSSASSIEYGAKDCGDVSSMIARQALSKPEYSAQWCLGLSASLQALARAKLTLLENNGEPAPLLAELSRQLDDMLNRNLAVLSAPGAIKSTGHDVPGWRVIEAYEAVTDLDGRVRFVPGAHPLAWGAAQLYDGLKRALLAAELEEKMR